MVSAANVGERPALPRTDQRRKCDGVRQHGQRQRRSHRVTGASARTMDAIQTDADQDSVVTLGCGSGVDVSGLNTKPRAPYESLIKWSSQRSAATPDALVPKAVAAQTARVNSSFCEN